MYSATLAVDSGQEGDTPTHHSGTGKLDRVRKYLWCAPKPVDQDDRPNYDSAHSVTLALSGPKATYFLTGSADSGSSPNSAMAAWARFLSNLPSRARRDSAAAAIASAPFSKCLRKCSRFSLRPKPSVPSDTKRPINHGAIWSATTFM